MLRSGIYCFLLLGSRNMLSSETDFLVSFAICKFPGGILGYIITVIEFISLVLTIWTIHCYWARFIFLIESNSKLLVNVVTPAGSANCVITGFESKHETTVQPSARGAVHSVSQTGEVQEAAVLSVLLPLSSHRAAQILDAWLEHHVRLQWLWLRGTTMKSWLLVNKYNHYNHLITGHSKRLQWISTICNLWLITG